MMVRRIRLLLILMVISQGLWIAFAKLVVPAVIESAYRGELGEQFPALRSLHSALLHELCGGFRNGNDGQRRGSFAGIE